MPEPTPLSTARSPASSLPPEIADRPLNTLAFRFAEIAIAAGAIVMEIYTKGARVRTKADASPVCDADEQAEAIIEAHLSRLVPGLPILAEEAASRGHIPALDGRFAVVDPVDGTKEFLNRNGEFTINIALVDHGTPCAGVVYAPAIERLWFAGEDAFACSPAPGPSLTGSVLRPIRTRPVPAGGYAVMASRSHADARTEAFLAALPVTSRANAGSSLKFCALAEGQADLYPRFGPTMEWDTAAGDAVLRAAGGLVLDSDGRPLRYGKRAESFRNGPFVAWADPEAARRDHAAGLARA